MNIIRFFLLGLILISKSSLSQTSLTETTSSVEVVIIPTVGDRPFYLDSNYVNPSGEQYKLKKFKFFISDLALARSIGEETSIESKSSKEGVYLVDFKQSNMDKVLNKQAIKFEFKIKAGEYSDFRFNVGLPRKLNHLDPTSASPPLDIAKGDMFWAWNSGYIFVLMDGKRLGSDKEFFHFAIGGDTRIMPIYFGNLFNISPLIKVVNGKKTRIVISLDINKIFINGDGTKYSIASEETAIIHGGNNADLLRNNFIKCFKFISSEIVNVE